MNSEARGSQLQRWMVTRRALMAWVALPSAASAGSSSTSSVGTPTDFVQDSGALGSAVSVDADQYARSPVLPQHGTLGAAASNSNADFGSFSRSSFDDTWTPTCPEPGTCTDPPPGARRPPGSHSTAAWTVCSPTLAVWRRQRRAIGRNRASYTIVDVGSFNFRVQENVLESQEGPLGAGSSGTYAEFCRQGSGRCLPLALDIAAFSDADDNDLFRCSLSAIANRVLLPIPSALSMRNRYRPVSPATPGLR
jgi:hypothetical protein